VSERVGVLLVDAQGAGLRHSFLQLKGSRDRSRQTAANCRNLISNYLHKLAQTAPCSAGMLVGDYPDAVVSAYCENRSDARGISDSSAATEAYRFERH
jgi:hypothetical protein